MTDELNPQVGRNALDDLETAAEYVSEEIAGPADARVIRDCIEDLKPFVDAAIEVDDE